jgi:hypothetical protein
VGAARRYVEIASGKRSDRTEPARALAHAKATGATLVIAKLDRLSRNVAFISNLMERGVEFVAADMPMANRLTVHVLAAVAEHEREMISQCTTAVLAAAKARGIKLGNPNGARVLRGLGNAHALAAVKAGADAHPSRVLPVIEAIRGEGMTSLHGMAAELNRRAPRRASSRRRSESLLFRDIPQIARSFRGGSQFLATPDAGPGFPRTRLCVARRAFALLEPAQKLSQDPLPVALAGSFDTSLGRTIATTRITCACAASRHGSRPSAGHER